VNISRINPVELAAELKTGSRLPTGEYTSPDTTQLYSTWSVFNFSVKSVGGSSREVRIQHTSRDANATVELRWRQRRRAAVWIELNVLHPVKRQIHWVTSLCGLVRG